MLAGIFHAMGDYYGADWLSMAVGFAGSWMITSRDRRGFIFMMVSLVFATGIAFVSRQYGFVVADIISIAIAVRGLLLWKKEAAA